MDSFLYSNFQVGYEKVTALFSATSSRNNATMQRCKPDSARSARARTVVDGVASCPRTDVSGIVGSLDSQHRLSKGRYLHLHADSFPLLQLKAVDIDDKT